MSFASALALAFTVLLLPGLVAARAGGLRGWTALGMAPALSVASAVVAGGACRGLGLDGAHLPGLLALALVTALGAAVARTVHHRAAPTRVAGACPRHAWAPAAPLVAGAVGVGTLLGRAIGTPDAWPQIHDTIFHIGTVAWLVRHGSAWVGDVSGYALRPYPGGWHVVTALVSGNSGADAVVASHAVLLVATTIVWPLSMLLLARTVLGPSPTVGATAVAGAFLFYGMPYQFLTWGVVWPNLLSLAVLPAALACLCRVADSLGAGSWVLTSAESVLLVAVAATALLAHPSAAYSLLLLGTPLAAGRLLASGRRALAVGALVSGVVTALFAWSVTPPPALAEAGSLNPTYRALDVVAMVLSGISSSTVAAVAGLVAVAVGCVAASRTGQHWVIWGVAAPTTLAVAAMTLPHDVAVVLTWPWYSDVTRIRAVAVIPAVLAMALLPGLLVRLPSRPRPELAPVAVVATCALSLATIVATAPIVAARYRPTAEDQWWATPEERVALRQMAAELPEGAVVAADPFRGGTFLALDREVTLLFPVADPPPEAIPAASLLAASLNTAPEDPAVCRAVAESGLTHVLTGGDPHPDELPLGTTYAGIDRVATAGTGFTPTSHHGVYTLWVVDGCRS